jgi:hypothetical protein
MNRNGINCDQQCPDLLCEVVRALGLLARESFQRPNGGDMFLLKGFVPFIPQLFKYAKEYSSITFLIYSVLICCLMKLDESYWHNDKFGKQHAIPNASLL